VATADVAFAQRTNLSGERIVSGMSYIVYHTGLRHVVKQIQQSELVPELATNAVNTARSGWMAIEDPYIVGTAPNLPWYAFTDPRVTNVIPFVLVRMSGWDAPRIFRRRSDIESVTSILGAGAPVEPVLGDFESSNVVLKVVDIWGTYIDGTNGNYFDYRGGYQSTGTTP
jgi:hypothetical protein